MTSLLAFRRHHPHPPPTHPPPPRHHHPFAPPPFAAIPPAISPKPSPLPPWGRYGRRTWTLWGRQTSWSDCKEALSSIGRVAGDVIERLLAEFHADDLYSAYMAFDLDAWPAAPAGSKVEQAARRLCTALGVQHDASAWQAAVRSACAERAQRRGHRPRPCFDAGLHSSTDNRLAWRVLLDTNRLPQSLLPLVRFYLATWDGTGAIERGLGQDAAIMKEHIGKPPRSCFDAGLYSALLELKLEGPQREEDLFTKGEAGILHLTDFSRACAAEWLAQRGRRFTCTTATRKDKGQRAPCRDNKHTDRGVQLRARAAYGGVCRLAEADKRLPVGKAPLRSTILGVDRAKLMVAVGRHPRPPDGKKTIRFRAATERKVTEKRKVVTWAGWVGQAPSMRLGGAAAVIASSQSGFVQAVKAKMWLSRVSRASTSGTKPTTTAVSASASTSRAPLVARSTLDDLFRRRTTDPSTGDLLTWLQAIAHGGSVRCDTQTHSFRPTLLDSTAVVLEPNFCRKHPRLAEATRAIVNRPGCKWRNGPASGAVAHRVSTKLDFVEFLLRMRRSDVVASAALPGAVCARASTPG